VASSSTKSVAGALTSISNTSDTVPPLPSSAVTFTVNVPTSPAWGVPLKVRLPAVKVSQPGNALSSPWVAL